MTNKQTRRLFTSRDTANRGRMERCLFHKKVAEGVLCGTWEMESEKGKR